MILLSKILSFIKDTSIVWKTTIGSAVTWRLAQLAGSSHPYLAPITLILCLQSTLNQSIHFAVHRVFGTALGILITVILASFFSVTYLTIGLLIFIGTAIGKLFNMSHLVIHQIALSILLVFTFAHHSPSYGIDRLRDTLIGALIAFALAALILPIDLSKQAEEKFYFYIDELITNFSATAQWISNGCDLNEGARLHIGTQQLLKDLHQLGTQLEKAMKNLHLNPYSKKHKAQLSFLNQEILHLKQGYAHISGMLRSLADWSRMGTMAAYDFAIWSSYFYSFAAYISEWKNAHQSKDTMNGRASYDMKAPIGLENSVFNLSLYKDALELLADFNPNIPTQV